MMRIGIPAQPARHCAPAELLKTLYSAGRLVMLSEAMAVEKWTAELGNCHEAATALMADLIGAGRAHGWYWAIGRQKLLREPGWRKHSWLEVADWALDLFPDLLMFADREWYRRLHRARSIKLRDGDAFGRYWLAQAAAAKAGSEGLRLTSQLRS
jgi:hypothetical protein